MSFTDLQYHLRSPETFEDHSNNQRRQCCGYRGTTFQNRQLHVLFLLKHEIKHISYVISGWTPSKTYLNDGLRGDWGELVQFYNII